jgi:hypothetical protein
MKKFFLQLLLLAVIFAFLIILTEMFSLTNFETMIKIQITNIFYFLLAFLLFLLSSVGFKRDNPKLFVKIVSMNMFIRLFSSVIFISIILIFSDIDLLSYVVANIILYFIYMAFEIKYLLPNLRPDSEKENNVGNAHK